MLQTLIDTITLPAGDQRAWLARVAQEAQAIRKLPESDVDELFEQLLQVQAQLATPGDVGANLLEPEQFHEALLPVLAELNQREALAQHTAGPRRSIGGVDLAIRTDRRGGSAVPSDTSGPRTAKSSAASARPDSRHGIA